MRAYVPRSERISVNREFAVVEEHLSEYVTNISRTGAFIRSREPLPIGTRVNLKFSLILDEIEFIEGIGEVVRISQNPPGMGVVFRQLGAESQALIERLCQAAPKHERHP
ncbi:MAG: PilZ domain-containing protein [Myxococcales bacterium]|nr:PilZ domain-containing protein [Myxococcota bacterium]MDW8282640.1 PilZ domain-containing protein [Myxococcales bacterium]